MEKLEIDLVDTKTEVENHQREDTKPGIFHDATIIAKEMDANKQNDVESDVKMENDLQNTNRHCEISAKNENVNGYSTEQGTGIKYENVQNQSKNEENQIDFAIHETIEAKLENDEITSYICGNELNLEQNSSALNEGSKKYTNTSQNVSKAIKSENDNEQRIGATNEDTNVKKIAISVEIKAKNEEFQNENKENQIGFSAKETKGDLDNNEENDSDLVQRIN